MSALRSLVCGILGALFGIGLTISGMIHPRKVQGFLDFTGSWDPSLLFVMAGAVGVTLVAFPWILRRDRPLLAPRFHVPVTREIDGPLILGAVLFGVGWGLSGFCPGPALVGLATGSRSALIFVGAMLLGMALHRAYQHLRQPRHG